METTERIVEAYCRYVKGWATIDNTSGATYENAKLKLIAGEVHRVEEPKMYRDMPMMEMVDLFVL